MRYSGVGGQAVMEGIMMKNEDKYSVAVRKPDKEIEIKVEDYNLGQKFKTIRKLPIFRGVFSFVDPLYLGMSTLMYSASFFEEEEEADKELSAEEDMPEERELLSNQTMKTSKTENTLIA